MNYTNEHNLDDWVCRYLAKDDYDHEPGVISATTLISPARAWALKQMYADKLTMDYSDLIRLRNGTSVHAAVEMSGAIGTEHIQEKRFYAERMGFKISGKMDMVIDGVIADIKNTSVWKIVSGDYTDYVKQLSIYRWLLAENGIETADYGFIHFFFTDWRKADALKGGSYPKIPYHKQRINLWSLEQTEKFILERLEDFAFALGALPRCTQEELWQSETTYAFYSKPGAAKATKVYSEAQLGEAEIRVAETGGQLVKRPGVAKRCGYCTAAPFCEQYKELKRDGLIDGD